MNAWKLLAPVALAVMLSGCLVVSLQPLYTAEDAVFDAKLVGSWKETSEGKATVVFRRDGDKAYEAVYKEDSDTIVFQVRLLQVGSALYLDLAAKEEAPKSDLWVMGHAWMRFRMGEDWFEISPLDEDHLKAAIAARQIDIAQKVGDKVVFTAPTPKLREFLVKHGSSPGVFQSPTRYRRTS